MHLICTLSFIQNFMEVEKDQWYHLALGKFFIQMNYYEIIFATAIMNYFLARTR